MSTEVEGPKSSQGIPPAEFIEDVDAYMSKKADKETPDEVVQSMNEMYSKYKFMEQSLSTKKGRLNRQIPDIEQTLEMLRLLKEERSRGGDHHRLPSHRASLRQSQSPSNRKGLSVVGRQCDAGVPHGRSRGATFQEPRVSHQERRDHQRRPRLPQGPDHHHRGLDGQTPQLESQEGTNGLRGLR